MRLRRARVDDAEAIERIRIRCWQVASEDAILWTLEDNPPTRRFYEAAGWRPDGTTGSFERFGVKAPLVRYAKRLSSAANRSGSAR